MTKFLNISIDNTLGGNSPSDTTVSSQKAIKAYVDAQVGPSGVYHPDLFDVKWSDHQLNDISWLRADTFSWQDGTVYSAAYQHLVSDISGKTLQSETIAGTTVQFYLADDGHKICPANQEGNVFTILLDTRIAWYYILDTTNQRFKLPVTQWGFVGLRNAVGGYVEPGLPNITGSIGPSESQNGVSGAFYTGSAKSGYYHRANTGSNKESIDFDASLSSSIYGNSTTVQPAATQMYLYFYVGNFTQTAIENTAGLNAELFNNKADKTFTNTDMIDYVVEKQEPSAANDYTWYRKYKSGWVEQGGKLAAAASAVYVVTLPVAMADTSYTAVGTLISNTVSGSGGSFATVYILSSTQINLALDYASTWTGTGCFWVAYGKAA